MGEQLRNAEAPVPAGAWEAIRSEISPGTSSGASLSPAGAIVGLIAGIAILATVSLTSGEDTAQMQEAAVREPGKTQTVETQESATDSDKPNTAILDDQIVLSQSEALEEEANQPAVKVISKETSTASDSEAENHEAKINFEPITKNEVTEIDSHIGENEAKPVMTTDQIEQASEASKTTESIEPEETINPARAEIRVDEASGYAPLQVEFNNAGSGSQFYWDFGTYAESNEKNPVVVFEKPGVYTVNLTVSNAEGEISQDYLEITVKEGSKFFIPNSFTPNGDGLNDTYKVGAAKNIESFYMLITTDEGKTVFQTRNTAEAWEFNGATYNRSGTRYFVTYRAVGIDGKVYSAKLQPITILK